MMRVAGLDIGFSPKRKTSGAAIIIGEQVRLSRHKGGQEACEPIIAAGRLHVIAIDGPIIPEDGDAEDPRDVERVFASGSCQRRCKPGFSHIRGTGLQLRKAAGCTADLLASAAPLDGMPALFPLARQARIVEAFPNAFLGVCLEDQCYSAMPKLKRGKKFDWLYRQWVCHDLIARLPLSEEREMLRARFACTSNHEERAALVCVLTALLVARGTYTAVGDERGGWFFLPPWGVWQDWARCAVVANCKQLNGSGAKLHIAMAGAVGE